MSVYVLGAGGVGTLIASSLSKQFNVNFIVRNAAKLNYLKNTNNTFQIKQLFNNDKIIDYKINGAYTTETIPDGVIDFLLISVKTFDTVNALTPLLNKINSHTKILLVQNGMGVVDQLYEKLWKEESERPIIYQGVISHGVWQSPEQNNTYNYNHAGFGYLKICQIPRNLKASIEELKQDEISMRNDKFIDALLNGDLNVTGYSYDELLVYQIQKFLVNCCMNATTSIVDCINYKLSDLKETDELFTAIISEGLKVLFKAYPSLQSSELAKDLLNTEKQLNFVKYVGFTINSKNSTSMRQDVINLRNIEIDYINGHIVKKAIENEMSAPVNDTIRKLVQIKLATNRRTAEEAK